MPDPTTQPDPINPIDAATAIVQQIVTITARAKSRDQRIADLHTDTSRQHPLAPDQKVFDHVVAVAEQDAQSLEADMRAADALASNLIRALESEADRTSRLPTDADALAGTKGETVQATLLARLLDATVRASVEAWLPTLTPAALLAWYRATADEQDAPRVREVETAVLDRGWRPAVTSPDQAMPVDELVRAMRARRQGRVGPALREAQTNLDAAVRQLRTWRLLVNGLPKVDRGVVQDAVRRLGRGQEVA